MVAGNLQHLSLEHYLRLVRATPPEWLAGLAHFTGGQDLTLCTRAHGFSGAISWLARPGVGVAVIETGMEASLLGTNTADPAIIAVLNGRISLICGNDYFDTVAGGGFILPPHARVELSGTRDLKLAVARLTCAGEVSLQGGEARPASRVLVHHMICYLRRAHFFRSHQHALTETDRFGELLRQCLYELPGEGPLKPCLKPELDRRAVRMVELIATCTEREFDIGRISAMAGVSTRNLYYLMRKYTGMTPYQFFLSRRLVRVRRALLECQCDVPTVSWHALSEGFSHLGRFSALYRKHFGEYPRETLQWRNVARKKAAAITPADCSAGPADLCLTTG